MTKKDLIQIIHDKYGIDKNAIYVIVEELMGSIRGSIINGESVYLRHFGTFEVKHKKARYQNIKQGTDRLFVPEHSEPSFKPCKEFIAEVAKLPVKENN